MFELRVGELERELVGVEGRECATLQLDLSGQWHQGRQERAFFPKNM